MGVGGKLSIFWLENDRDGRSILKKLNRSFYIENSIGIEREWGLNWRVYLAKRSLFFE